MTITDVKKFVKRHKVVIFGGVMLGAGIVIGRRMDISYNQILESDLLNRVGFATSEKDGYDIDIVVGNKDEKRAIGFAFSVNEAKKMVETLNDLIKEVE